MTGGMCLRLSVVALAMHLAVACWARPAPPAEEDDLAAMADQLDAADRADFMDALDKASGCTQARNFACTEAQLKKAAKLAHGSVDKRQLAAARQALSAERTQVAEEARQQAELAEQERKLADAEERLRVAEAQAREAEADSQPSTASQLLQFGALVAQNYAANKAGAAAAARSAQLPLADLSADRQRIADQRAKLAAAREQAEGARRANVQAAQARAAQARATDVTARSTPNAPGPTGGQGVASASTGGVLSSPANLPTSSGVATAAPDAGAGPAATGGKKSYPGLPKVINDFETSYGMSEKASKTWCDRKPQDLRNDFLGSENNLISTGSCGCTVDNSMAPMQPTYDCKIYYVWRQNVPGNSK